MRTSPFISLSICLLVLITGGQIYAQVPNAKEQIEAILEEVEAGFMGTNIALVGKKLEEAKAFMDQYGAELGAERFRFDLNRRYLLNIYRQDLGYLEKVEEGYHAIINDIRQQAKLQKADSILMIQVYLALGGVYQSQGDYDRAESHYFKALGLQPNPEINLAYVATTARMAKKYDQSLAYYQRAITACKERFKVRKAGRYALISSYQGMAQTYLEQGDIESAIQQLNISLSYHPDNAPFYARTYDRFGTAYLAGGDYDGAIQAFGQSLALIRDQVGLEYNYRYASRHSHIGDALFQKGEVQAALEQYQQALFNLSKGFEDPNIATNPSLEQISFNMDVLSILNKKTKAFFHLRKAHPTNTTYGPLVRQTTASAIELIDQIRADYLADEDKQLLLTQSYAIFEMAIDQAMEEKRYADAFQLSEQSKAVVLFNTIKSGRAKESAGLDADMLEKESQLLYNINHCELLMRNAETEKELLALRDQRFELKQKYQDLLDQISQNAAYKKIMRQSVQPTVADIRSRLLKEGQAMLQFFDGEQALYAFLIQPQSEGVEAKKIRWTDSLINAVTQFNEDIYNRKVSPYIDKAHFLFQQLIAPFFKESQLPEQLIIIPDGRLGYIPFNALLTARVAAGQEKNFKSHPYLFRKSCISQDFSAAVLLELQQERPSTQWANEVLIYAPSFKAKTIKGEARSGERGALLPLNFNQQEGESIESIFQGLLCKGLKATKNHFMEYAEDSRLLHIASHAKVDDQEPDYSYIAFTDEASQNDQEFKLNVNELYNQLHLKADMVVLSACETGVGKIVRGEGIISIARAFIYAGAKSILTSLWSVNDESTALLMEKYYAELYEGQSKEKALQSAMSDYLEKAIDGSRAHPKYWAAFVPIGNMEPIHSPCLFSNKLIWLLLAALFALLFFLGARKRASSK